MSQAMQVIAIAAPFVWLGMVLAISFLETPLKFRAPGIALPLGLGIGRLVFRALNLAEVGLAILATAACLSVQPDRVAWVLLGAAWLLLVVQVVVVRRSLDRRVSLIVAGQTPPPSRGHLAYVVLELVKVVLLAALGATLISGELT
jgi:hypothetical protein